jgi:hypothetical protein
MAVTNVRAHMIGVLYAGGRVGGRIFGMRSMETWAELDVAGRRRRRVVFTRETFNSPAERVQCFFFALRNIGGLGKRPNFDIVLNYFLTNN